MKNMLLLANMRFDYPLHNVQWNRTDLFFALSLHAVKMNNHTLKILTVAKVKPFSWKYMA